MDTQKALPPGIPPQIQYRINELLSLGFSTEQSESLAYQSTVSVSDIRERFIKKGCTVELAWRILNNG